LQGRRTCKAGSIPSPVYGRQGAVVQRDGRKGAWAGARRVTKPSPVAIHASLRPAAAHLRSPRRIVFFLHPFTGCTLSMRRSSRRQLPSPARTVPGTVPGVLQRVAFWSFIAILACATGTISVAHPAATALTVTALVSCGAWLNNREKTRLQALAAARNGESICGFARSFDLRSTDPLVVRAVYARLQSEAAPQPTAFH